MRGSLLKNENSERNGYENLHSPETVTTRYNIGWADSRDMYPARIVAREEPTGVATTWLRTKTARRIALLVATIVILKVMFLLFVR